MSRQVLDEELGQPYLNFINSLKSKETKREYRYALLSFVKHYDITLQGLLILGPREIEQMISTYITNMNARGLSYGYMNLVMAAIFHFFDMNDILLNKRKVSKFLAESKRSNKDRAYTDEEIKSLVDTGDFRFRALILLLASTGVRIGCIPSLLVRHLDKKGDVAKGY
jgi:integrase